MQLKEYRMGTGHSADATALCGFGPGTTILTDKGDVPVEWLDTSYRVLTRDNGYQPLLRVWRTRFGPDHSAGNGADVAVRVPAGALGDGRPLRDLHVTANLHLLLRAPGAARRHGTPEVLAPAIAWADLGRAETCVPRGGWSVTHVACMDFEVILAEGAWVQTSPAVSESRAGPRWASAVRRAGQMAREIVDPVSARPTIGRRAALDLIENSRDTGAARWPDSVVKRA